jgi:Fur family transcriptional regulator, ferric uptake regulator
MRSTPAANGRAPDLATLERLCSEKGIRITEQRRVVMRVVADAHDYPDIEELHRRAMEIDAGISLSTIYRSVRLFQELGLLERHPFLHGPARYEAAVPEHHDHLIDIRTGRVVEFRCAEIERLQAKIAAAHGYRIVDHRLELYAVPLARGEADGRPAGRMTAKQRS